MNKNNDLPLYKFISSEIYKNNLMQNKNKHINVHSISYDNLKSLFKHVRIELNYRNMLYDFIFLNNNSLNNPNRLRVYGRSFIIPLSYKFYLDGLNMLTEIESNQIFETILDLMDFLHVNSFPQP